MGHTIGMYIHDTTMDRTQRHVLNDGNCGSTDIMIWSSIRGGNGEFGKMCW
jgi:hypothetical protein